MTDLSDAESKLKYDATAESTQHNKWCDELKSEVEFQPLRDFIDRLKDPE
jgi:hypothetical protein